MKKIIHMLCAAIALSIVMISTIDARRSGQLVTANKQELVSSTQQLQADLKKVVTTKNPEEKQQAIKTATEEAEKLLKKLDERSLVGDVLTGYDETQVNKAKAKLEKLFPLQTRLDGQIQLLEQKLAPITDKGLIWNSAKPGKEKEYDALSSRLTSLNNTLQKVNRAIRNQKVIAGEEWSNAFRAVLLGSALLGADAFTGGATAKVGSYAATYVPATFGKIKTAIGYGSEPISQQILTKLPVVTPPADESFLGKTYRYGSMLYGYSQTALQIQSLITIAMWGLRAIAQSIAELGDDPANKEQRDQLFREYTDQQKKITNLETQLKEENEKYREMLKNEKAK